MLKDLIFSDGEKILFYGIGNLGRQDDGLGIHLVTQLQSAFEKKEFISKKNIQYSFEMNYQLNIEDALLISKYDVVVFIDASKEKSITGPFELRKVESKRNIEFTTHAMSIESVLGLCEDLYGKSPRLYALSIPGQSWEIGDTMTPEAWSRLELCYASVFGARSCFLKECSKK
jgi:hydrogenase maturation protease